MSIKSQPEAVPETRTTLTLNDRMKDYERTYRTNLPANSYVIVRLDGKAFHTFTRGFERPFDLGLMGAMDTAARTLCETITQGVVMSYTQSDEISLLITDIESDKSQQWYDGQVQKIVSVAASIATAAFNAEMAKRRPGKPLAFFDARAFVLPNVEEVQNYFKWRQRDCRKNAVYMIAHTHFGHRALEGKDTSTKLAMLNEVPGAMDSIPPGFLAGRTIRKERYMATITYTDKRTGQENTVDAMRRRWVQDDGYFTDEFGEWIGPRIPRKGSVRKNPAPVR